MPENKLYREVIIINQNGGHVTFDLIKAFYKTSVKLTLVIGKNVKVPNCILEICNIKRIIQYKRNSKWARLWTWIIGTFQIFLIVKFKHKNSFLFFFSNPQTSVIIPLLCKNQFSFMIYDIFPDTLFHHQILNENAFIIRLWKKVNTKVFNKALKIFTISEAMKNVLLRYTTSDKLKVVPLWHNSDINQYISKEHNIFLKENSLSDKFIVLYSGNIGLIHNVDVIIDIAQKVSNPKVLFLIIGDGDKKKELKIKSEKLKLENIQFLNYQPVELLSYSLSAADIGIVTLGKGSSSLSVPSKLFNLMALGIPILGIAEKDTELANIIDTHKLGMCFRCEQIHEITDFINSLVEDSSLISKYKNNCLRSSKIYTNKNADIIVNEIINKNV